MRARNARKLFFWAIAGLVAIGVSALGVELGAIGYLTVRESKYVSVAELHSRTQNTYIADATRSGQSCRYLDTLFPHPYLGFVHHANPPCGLPHINNIGLFGVDFPSERATDAYVVLLTGGSVAAQLGQIAGPTAPRFLELSLNEKFISPNGKPFRVLNGGDGAWKQPQQLMLFLLYVDAIDAVVTLDGFNEYWAVMSPRRFEQPGNNFLIVNPLAAEDYSSIVWKWLSGKLIAYLKTTPVVRSSHAAYLLAEGLEKQSQAAAKTTKQKRTTVDSIFALPTDWDETKRAGWAIDQYKKYILAMDAVARDRGVAVAHFIQPVPALGKSLTAEERAVVGDLGYRDGYEKMSAQLLGLRASGIRVYSLLNVFAAEASTLYNDPIHLQRTPTGDSHGYRLMAARMAALLGEAWRLEPTSRKKPLAGREQGTTTSSDSAYNPRREARHPTAF